MRSRGYHLSSQTAFTDGSSAHVLGIYTESEQGTGYGFVASAQFPDLYPGEWVREGARPFSVAGRPSGDFWQLAFAMRDNKDVEWQFRYELTRDQLKQALDSAKEKGFRLESLFVCPGTARYGFGVVLTRDKPEMLWEVGIALTSTDLISETASMSERGYIPDQVVGYAVNGASRYLACWTRDPGRYPATGLGDPSLEAIDEALEQFLIDNRIPSATFAVFGVKNEGLVLSRGYGYEDFKARKPLGPKKAMHIRDLSVPLAAAAVRSLMRNNNKKLHEDALVSELLRASTGGALDEKSASEPGMELSKLTVGSLLDGLDQSDSKFGEKERAALIVPLRTRKSSPKDKAPLSDLELRGALFDRILEAATGKPSGEAIASELRPGRGQGAKKTTAAPSEHIVDLVAAAQRSDELLFVVLLNLLDDTPLQLDPDLCTCLDRALRSLPAVQSSTVKPQARAR
jgi:hypothetical protein